MKILETSKEFKEHTENHIQNVNRLAEYMLDTVLEDPEMRDSFNIPLTADSYEVKEKALSVISLHDKAKVCEDPRFLIENDLEEPLYESFYRFIGKSMNEYPELKTLINKLNSIDEAIIVKGLEGEPDWMHDFVLKIEKYSDSVERGCNYITKEELGREPVKASVFLENFVKNHELNLVKMSENVYDSIAVKYIPEHLQNDSIEFPTIDLNTDLSYNGEVIAALSKKSKIKLK